MKNAPAVLIVRTAGTNCDQETKTAFEMLGAQVTLEHINTLVEQKKVFSRYQIIAFPGGFTYGDDIAAGKIMANELRMKLFDVLQTFVQRGGLMIGICNGFQILVKVGILPGNDEGRQEVTLGCNDSAKFEARWIYLRPFHDPQSGVRGSCCVWTRGMSDTIYLPIAHGEGKFITQDDAVLERLRANRQIVLQYCTRDGQLGAYPDNPNGSREHIAGICDPTGRIFGLMPHPERHLFVTQHPRWTRGEAPALPHGLKIFKNAIDYLTTA